MTDFDRLKLSRRAALVGLAALALHPARARAAAPRPAPLDAKSRADVARVQAYLNGITTLQSRFDQVADDGGVASGTIVSTYTDGRVVKVYVNPDHSYSITLPDGKILKGTWADADGQSCFHQTDPAPAATAKPACFLVKEYKIGDSFSGEDAGGKFTAVIKAGR